MFPFKFKAVIFKIAERINLYLVFDDLRQPLAHRKIHNSVGSLFVFSIGIGGKVQFLGRAYPQSRNVIAVDILGLEFLEVIQRLDKLSFAFDG